MENKHKALCLLLSKDNKNSLQDFENLLEENIQNASNVLRIDHSSIHKLIPELSYNKNSSDHVQWKFIGLCFHILLLPDENNDILSITHLSNIKTAFQFIMSLGLLPNLIPGVGIDVKLRFKNFDIVPVEEIGIFDKYYRLRSVTQILLKCMETDSLKNYILENHINDILAALIQLTYAPLKKPNDNTNSNLKISEEFYLELMQDRKLFKTKLHDLILNMHQPIIFRELMFLNGNKKSPLWVKNNVLQILMERIQAKNGVESLIMALFDSGSEDTGLNWKHWEVLTKLLMTKPNYVNDDEYYQNICNQLIKLLDKRTFDGKRIHKFETAVVLCTIYLFEFKENICIKFFLNPLIQILLKFTDDTNYKINSGTVTNEIEQVIFILHSIFFEKKTNDKIIPILFVKPILLVLYNMFFICINTSKTKLTQEIMDILVKYILVCEDVDKNKVYENFLFGTNIKDIFNVKKDLHFCIDKDEILLETKENNLDLFSRSDCCIYLLEKSKNDIIISSFFTYLLEMFLKTFQNCNNSDLLIDSAERKIIIYQLLLKLLENQIVLKNLNKNPSDLLIFTENFLKILTDQNVHKSTDYDSEDFQTLFLILMIINSLIKNCDDKNIINDHNILTNILHKISIETNNNELKLLINEIYILKNDNSTEQTRSEYENAIEEICSPLIPEQAHGLATIVKLIEKKDPETCCKKQYVLNIFQQNLKSEEPFIYLRAIAGLAALTDAFPNTILETLTDEYANPRGATEKDSEVRMKIGEVLIRVTSLLGDLAVKYKSVLLNTFLGTARDSDPLIRASSLSNLGEVCKVLGFRLGAIVTEILNCVHDIISFELAVEVRRAAVSVIRQIFIGLGKDMIAILKEDILPLYRTLKTTYRDDPDSVTRLQAQLALEELNEIMRSLIAPDVDLKKNFVIPNL